MSFGLEVYSQSGILLFHTDSYTVMQVATFYVGANQIVTRNFPLFEGWYLRAFVEFTDEPPGSTEHYCPVVIVSGVTVTVQPQAGLPSYGARVIVLAEDSY